MSEFQQREALKAECKQAASNLRAAGFDVFSSGYGSITMRVKPTDEGYTVVPLDEAKKLLAA